MTMRILTPPGYCKAPPRGAARFGRSRVVCPHRGTRQPWLSSLCASQGCLECGTRWRRRAVPRLERFWHRLTRWWGRWHWRTWCHGEPAAPCPQCGAVVRVEGDPRGWHLWGMQACQGCGAVWSTSEGRVSHGTDR